MILEVVVIKVTDRESEPPTARYSARYLRNSENNNTYMPNNFTDPSLGGLAKQLATLPGELSLSTEVWSAHAIGSKLFEPVGWFSRFILAQKISAERYWMALEAMDPRLRDIVERDLDPGSEFW